MAKTIPVKLPPELVEIAKARDGSKPPGEVLLDMIRDYLRLEAYAKAIASSEGKEVTSASEVIIRWQREADDELNSIKKQARETMTMLEGMEIFFRKSNRGEDYGKRRYGKEERGRE